MDISPFYNVVNLENLLFDSQQIDYDRFSNIKFSFQDLNHETNRVSQTDSIDGYLISELLELYGKMNYSDLWQL